MSDDVEVLVVPGGYGQSLYLHAQQKVRELDSEKCRLEESLKNNRSAHAWWTEIVKACEANVCRPCDGRGKFREWLAQDESRLVDCTKCNGRGRAPVPKDLIEAIGRVPTK